MAWKTAALGCVLALTACGGGGTDETTSTSRAADASGTATTTTTASGAVVAIDADPCDLVTTDEVLAATGLAVIEVVPQPPISCVFDLGADAGVDIFVAIEDGEGRLAGPAAVLADYSARLGDGNAEAVADLGDAAVFDSGFRALVVDAGGGRLYLVGVNGGYTQLAEPKDALIELARAALERL